jgi:hypothetical protein
MANQNNDIERLVKEISVPAEHARLRLIDANESYLFGSRGSFKSSLGIPVYVHDRVQEMPRSSGVGVGITFNNLYENTLPPFKAALLKWGFVEGVHFTMLQPPPKNWPKPYLGVVDKTYKNAMSWYNGTHIQFISLRRKASANGVSAQWGFFDEAKFMDEAELVDEILPIFRGNEEYFKHCSGYLSKFFLTDKKADPVHIKWLLKKRDLVNHKKIDLVISLQIELNRMKALYNTLGVNAKAKLKTQMYAVETRLAILRSNLVYVAEINADDVRTLLGDKWYNDKKRNSSKHDWNVIYMNQDPNRPGEAFYPSYDEKIHTYEMEDDIDPSKPFIISSDYQHTVSPIPIAQLSILPGNTRMSLNYVDEVYTLYPEGLRAAVRKFCVKQSRHVNKTVYYVYDHTAIGKENEADEPSVKVKKELELYGWTVIDIYTGHAPGHYDKYLDTIDWMENKEGDYFDIRINRARCKKLKISIEGSPAKTSGNETKKDKTMETEKGLDQSETTHFSDAFDMINDAVLKQKMIRPIEESIGFAFR